MSKLLKNLISWGPVTITWMLIVAVPIGTGYTVYHATAWPKAIAWLVGAVTFGLCLGLGELTLHGFNTLFGHYKHLP